MEQSYYPRLLMIDMTPVGHYSATGQVKKTFLENWPVDFFLQIYNTNTSSRDLRLITLGEDLQLSNKRVYNSHEATESGLAFNPDVIYFRPVDMEVLFDVAEEILFRLDKPLVIHIMDDWPERLRHSDHGKFNRIIPRLLKMINRAKVLLSISQAMSDVYQERYGGIWHPLANGVEPSDFHAKDWERRLPISREHPFIIRYMGGLAEDMSLNSVSDLAEVVSELYKESPVQLEIHTMDWYLKEARRKFGVLRGVYVNSLVDEEHYKSFLCEADALLIAYNFDERTKIYTGLSMANKMPECLVSGAIVLAYGPEQIATINYLNKSGVAEVIMQRDKKVLKDTLRKLISSKTYCKEKTKEALGFVKTNLSKATVKSRFRDYIANAVIVNDNFFDSNLNKPYYNSEILPVPKKDDLEPAPNSFELLSQYEPDSKIPSVHISLTTSFYLEAPVDELENNLRILLKNASNPFISVVQVLFEGDKTKLNDKVSTSLVDEVKAFKAKGKIIFKSISYRPDYYYIFNSAKELGYEYCLIANSDIVFDAAFSNKLSEDIIAGRIKTLLALTRWNRTRNGVFLQTRQTQPPWPELDQKLLPFTERNYLSYDTYILSSDTFIPDELSKILIGSFGCDTAIVSIYRCKGFPVVNPCLKLQTEHEDDKIRDYSKQAGRQQQLHAVDIMKKALLEYHKSSNEILYGLNNLHKLRSHVANIGRFLINYDNWFKLFRILGSAPWQNHSSITPICFTKVILDGDRLSEFAEEILIRIIKAVDANEFLEIHITGGRVSREYYLQTFKESHPYLKLAALILYTYDWHSVIFSDFATPKEIRIFNGTMLSIRNTFRVSETIVNGSKEIYTQIKSVCKSVFEVLLPTQKVIYDGSRILIEEFENQKGQILYKGIISYGNVSEISNGYVLPPPHSSNWIACVYDVNVTLSDKYLGSLSILVADPCKVYFMICRNGVTDFEGTSKTFNLSKGKHTLVIEHTFKHKHTGIRLQLGSAENIATVKYIYQELIALNQ